MNAFLEAYEALRSYYKIKEITFGITDVSGAFQNSGCRAFSSSVYLGRLSSALGILSALDRNYSGREAQTHASEYASRHFSSRNELEGAQRFTIYGAELKPHKCDLSYVKEALMSCDLRLVVAGHYVTKPASRIDGVSGLKGISLQEMQLACEIAGASLEDYGLIVISTASEAIKNLEKNMREVLLK